MRQLHRRWGPYTAGLPREVRSPPRAKLLELMGAIERMEDLVRRYCGRRDAEGNPQSLADDMRMSFGSFVAARVRESCAVELCETDVVC